ncbi:branched-chain amino acid ABC transporter permease [Chelatococcus reniformis]|uniref:Branched-chain amino acid ABC transporter permease n=1 Tax=Chelatococcus reniformis TaxID=1494448 RepID=A0A916UBP4_9HYPH|nr:branched-chain amino acid ABC transporter permease [Chelatococcus reniformis]GGC66369.1 hypothetical protein GCM10010994_26190 [Chelatococcus reniformis]
MLTFSEFILRGVLAGSIYVLLAVPMSLLFSTVRTIDFAVGAYALVAAAVAASVGGVLGIAAGLGAAVAGSAAMALIFLLLKRFGCHNHIIYALASFGVATALASAVLWQYGTQSFVRDSFSQFWSLAGIRISPQGVLNLVTALVAVTILYVVIQRSQLGRMMRAAAVNVMGSELAGIPVELIQVGTYLVGGLLGGIAGLLILFTAGLDYSAPLSLTLSGFAAAIVFGIDNPFRALFGGLAMGVAEALAAGYTSGMVTSMVPFLFLLIVLGTSRFGDATVAGDRT